MRPTHLLAFALLLAACGTDPSEPDTDGGRADTSTRSDGGGGSALPVRCPAGASDPVCRMASADNPFGEGPRPRDQSGLTPMLTGGVIDGERLLVGGAWGSGADVTGAVLAIDLSTGDRTVLSGAVDDPRTGEATTGDGPALGHVVDVGVRSDGDLVALSAVSGDRLELVRIDEATGDRTLLWYNELIPTGNDTSARCTDGASRDIPNFDPNSFAIGEDDAMYLVARPNVVNAGGIVAIDGDGTTCTVVSFSGVDQPESALRGTGPVVSNGMRGLRFAAGRVFGLQFTGSSIVAIDVDTGDREVVSSHASSGGVGTGGDLGLSRLDVDATGERIVTIDDETGGFTVLTEVDVASGDRTVADLVSNTANAPGEGGVWLHPSRPLYVAVAWRTAVVLVDPVSGEANLLSN